MSAPVVLNELSCQLWPDDEHKGVECIRKLAGALVELKRFRRKTFVLSHVRFGNLFLGSRPFSSFMSDASVRDSLRQILAFANLSPLESFIDLDADGVESIVGSNFSRGALFAHLLGTVTVSFPGHSDWSGPEIAMRLRELDIFGDIAEREAVVGNLAEKAHAEGCRALITKYRTQEVRCGADIWARRDAWFPSLRFLPRIEADLAGVIGGLLAGQIAARLFELEGAISMWDPVVMRAPEWESRVTPEAETRRHLCRFTALDGREEIYDLHARYTPGAGRVHFRLIPAERIAEVAYIGRKIGI